MDAGGAFLRADISWPPGETSPGVLTPTLDRSAALAMTSPNTPFTIGMPLDANSNDLGLPLPSESQTLSSSSNHHIGISSPSDNEAS